MGGPHGGISLPSLLRSVSDTARGFGLLISVCNGRAGMLSFYVIFCTCHSYLHISFLLKAK